MKITVYCRSTGDELEIEHTELNEELHSMEPVEEGERTEGEPKSAGGEGIASLFATALENREAAVLEEMRSEIAKLGQPRRAVSTTRPSTPSRGSDHVVSRNQPTDPLYRALYRKNAELREVRTPDLDHWGAKWFQGLVARDRTLMQLAKDKLNAITGRAVTSYLEGDVSGTDLLDGTAGDALPQNVNAVVAIARDSAAVLAPLVQNITLTSATQRVPTANAFTTGMVAEGATSTGAGPTVASVMFKAQKAQAFAKVSVEAMADAAFNLMSLLAVKAGSSLGALEDTQICTSNGTTPNITAAIVGQNVDEASTTVLVYEDLVKLYFALGKAYRTSPIWLGNAVTLRLVSQLVDGNSNPVLSFPGAANVVTDVVGATGFIFNKPVYEVPLADGQLIFGDPSGYGFGRRAGITAAASEHADFASDLIQLKFTERYDGNMLDAVALKQMSALATVA